MTATVMGLTLGLALLTLAASSPVGAPFPLGVAAGEVGPRGALLWTRAARPGRVTVEVARDSGFGIVALTGEADASADRDATVGFAAATLDAGTRYHYRFRRGSALSEVGTFITAPPEGVSADLTFAFSGDSDGTRVRGLPPFGPFTILDRVRADGPAFFLYLGDTIYSDSGLGAGPATTLEAYRAKYVENRRSIFLRNLLRSTSAVVVADDHEVLNDYDPASVPPERLAAALQAFAEYMPVPSLPGGRLYRRLRWGREVELIVLDTRGHRSPQVSKSGICDNPPGGRVPDLGPTLPAPVRQAFAAVLPSLARPVPPACLAGLADPGRTMLGAAQKTWLLQTLAASTATWKLVVTSVPMQELFALPYDRWEGYAAERGEILTAIRTAGVRNVVWLTTDSHATIINDIRQGMAPTGMVEVMTGPIATYTFAEQIRRVAPAPAVGAYAAFVAARVPQGLGARCAELDRFSYALVQIRAAAKTLTVTAKDSAGAALCPAPIVLRAE